MFAVIFLCEPKVHIIVPQSFIYGLSQQVLFNYGKNRNKKYLVFWSKRGNEDLNTIPNFELNICERFPPRQDEACYIGKIKYFYGKFLSNYFLKPVNIKYCVLYVKINV